MKTVGTCSAASSECSVKSGQTFFKVAPVKVWGSDPTKVEYTYAFIDEGSSVSLCSQNLVQRLGVPVSGTVVELHTCPATSLVNQRVDNLAVQGIEEELAFIVKDV